MTTLAVVHLLALIWVQSFQAGAATTNSKLVGDALAEMAASIPRARPSRNCNWTLQNAPQTYYIPDGAQGTWCYKRLIFPAAGYSQVKNPAKALWILVGSVGFQQVTSTANVCRQQMVQGCPFFNAKGTAFLRVQQLGARYPWTQATHIYPPTYVLREERGCRDWQVAVRDLELRLGNSSHQRDRPVWVLKPVVGHNGQRIRFLSRGFNEASGISKICRQHPNYIAQQMVWSTPVFRGGSVFSLRVLGLLTFMSEMKLMWNNRTGAVIHFADRPNDTIGQAARYVTNPHARRNLAPGQSGEDFLIPAVPEFDRLGPGAWTDCIAPQLKLALVAYVLSLFTEPTNVTRKFTKHRWYEMIGCDFLIDEGFKAHFLECNCGAGCTNKPHLHLFRGMYRFVLDEALRMSNQGPRAGTDVQGHEVLLDVAAGYA